MLLPRSIGSVPRIPMELGDAGTYGSGHLEIGQKAENEIALTGLTKILTFLLIFAMLVFNVF